MLYRHQLFSLSPRGGHTQPFPLSLRKRVRVRVVHLGISTIFVIIDTNPMVSLYIGPWVIRNRG
jgi:hypothetical protein